MGDPVYSMKDGEVVFVGYAGGCGYAVVVEHDDGSRATYCHLVDGSAVVPVNYSVSAGIRIGDADSTGNSTGPHLHITYRDARNARREYFAYTDAGPTASQLDAGGC